MHTNKAMRSFFGAREGGQDRNQDVFTPEIVIEAVIAVWPEGIYLDPAANEAAIVPAKYAYYEHGEHLPWFEFTYVNPPYRDLLKWVHRFNQGHEYMLLAPVRTNRKPIAQAYKRATRQCWLRPIAFVGYDQKFPAALTMAYYGTRIEAFDRAFENLGELVTVV